MVRRRSCCRGATGHKRPPLVPLAVTPRPQRRTNPREEKSDSESWLSLPRTSSWRAAGEERQESATTTQPPPPTARKPDRLEPAALEGRNGSERRRCLLSLPTALDAQRASALERAVFCSSFHFAVDIFTMGPSHSLFPPLFLVSLLIILRYGGQVGPCRSVRAPKKEAERFVGRRDPKTGPGASWGVLFRIAAPA